MYIYQCFSLDTKTQIAGLICLQSEEKYTFHTKQTQFKKIIQR